MGIVFPFRFWVLSVFQGSPEAKAGIAKSADTIRLPASPIKPSELGIGFLFSVKKKRAAVKPSFTSFPKNNMNRLEKAFELFDDYNRQDPRTIKRNDTDYPFELFYALQLYEWVRRLAPDASEALLLASRCQHIGRWQIPRDSYPQTKAGYLTWRKELAALHASKAAELLQQAGYKAEEIAAVRRILLKEGIKTNPDVQTMENALCLVFLQFQYEDFLREHDERKVVRILQKSWGKMDEAGRKKALEMAYGERGKALLQKALSG